MTIGSLLYQLFIMPLELMLEVIYGIARNMFGNPGLSIFLMSLVMNILLLPLYQKADEIQALERDKEKALEPVVKHIKKTFHGDERYMMLQTYYRQSHYKPYYALRGSLPLVLEIPFFVAAYHFLSNLMELQGGILGPIQNLGLPDGLMVIGSVTVNVLPILMTLINVISSAIYTKGFALKDKLTLFGMALIFLVLLYNSPSGLVFYWTLNNLFSLVKNLFYKLRNPKTVINKLLIIIGGICILFSVFIFHAENVRYRVFVLLIGLGMILFSFFSMKHNRIEFSTTKVWIWKETNGRTLLLGCILLSTLTGLLIPSAVIASSPEEFVQISDFYSPINHVINSTLCACGTFIIWFIIFYYLMGDKAKRIAEYCVLILCVISIMDYMWFGKNLGTLSSELVFDTDPSFPVTIKILNLIIISCLTIIISIIIYKNEMIVKILCVTSIIAFLSMSVVNIIKINAVVPTMKQTITRMDNEESAHFNLSKNGNNVMIVMLDRAISGYLPFILQEKPELRTRLDGFTYYPNTVSFGSGTAFGTPPIYGGYEYTPEAINERSDVPLSKKHNEALKLLPVLFDNAGYEVSVFDPPYAGYKWTPDLSIFDDYPGIKAFNTELGKYTILEEEEETISNKLNDIWRRNFFCYSIMKISPVFIQGTIYQSGTYFLEDSSSVQIAENLSCASGLNMTFVHSYSVLCKLPEIAQIVEEGNGFLFMSNQATHTPCLLSEPDYVPSEVIDNSAYDEERSDRFILDGHKLTVSTVDQMAHYHVNMASLLRLGDFFDWMRRNDVYDNTRIIIVSDHGWSLDQFEEYRFGSESYETVMRYNSLLLVKDYSSTGFNICDDFMTTADVPSIALENILDNPINPFTGNPINTEIKQTQNEQHIAYWDSSFSFVQSDPNVFSPVIWYSVHDNVFDLNNWQKLGEW